MKLEKKSHKFTSKSIPAEQELADVLLASFENLMYNFVDVPKAIPVYEKVYFAYLKYPKSCNIWVDCKIMIDNFHS